MLYLLAVVFGILIAFFSIVIGGENAAKKGHIAAIVASTVALLLLLKEFTIVNLLVVATIMYLVEALYKYIRFKLQQNKK